MELAIQMQATMKLKLLPAYRDVFVGNPARYTVGHSYDETDEAWAELLVTNGCAEAASDGDALQELSPDCAASQREFSSRP